MTRAFLAAALAVIGAGAAANPIAEVICAPTAEMTDRLTRQFGESRAALGVRNHEEVVEIWTRGEGETWTLVITYASGNSCIVAMGEDWIAIAPPEAPA